MAERLSNKIAVVTAAASGIGLACAEMFAREGARVIATDIDADRLSRVKGVEPHRLDVTDPAAIEAFCRDTGRIDVLFNCAGFVHHGTILDCSESDWAFSFDLNVRSMYRMIRGFLPGMIAGGGGSIINISSGASSVKGVPNRFVYGATKAALHHLIQCWAAETATPEQFPVICSKWAALRPEERWWLFAMTVAEAGLPEDTKRGWRRALFDALSDGEKPATGRKRRPRPLDQDLFGSPLFERK